MAVDANHCPNTVPPSSGDPFTIHVSVDTNHYPNTVPPSSGDPVTIHVMAVDANHCPNTVPPSSGDPVTIHVSVDANHCPRAVMYLFRGDFGCILCIGDFRWEAASPGTQAAGGMLLDALKGRKLDTLYMDNTKCNPSYCFPSCELAARQVIYSVSGYGGCEAVVVYSHKRWGCGGLFAQAVGLS